MRVIGGGRLSGASRPVGGLGQLPGCWAWSMAQAAGYQ